MGFNDPILSGVTLVRDAIQSGNYVAAVSGWTINSDGTAEFNSVTLRGTLASSNFVAGVSGWRLLNTGEAELNDATIRGSIFFPTGNPLINPGSIQPFFTDLSFQGPMDTTGSLVLPSWVILRADGSISLQGSSIDVTSTPGAAAADAFMHFNNDCMIRMANTTDASLSSTLHAFQIGDVTGTNLIMDNNEIMVRNNGAITPMFLQNDGGGLAVKDMRTIGDNDAGAVQTTASTTFVTLGAVGATGVYPASGTVLMSISARIKNSVAANAGVIGFEIHDTNAAGTLRFSTATAGGSGAVVFGTTEVQGSNTYLVTGLPTSGPMFVRPVYRSNNAANTATFTNSTITAMPSL